MTGRRLIAAGLTALVAGCRPATEPPLPDGPPMPLVVLAAPDADVWVQLLRASGAAARVGTLGEMLDRRAGVISAGARLVGDQVEELRQWISSGGRAVTAHDGLVEAVGFARARTTAVARVVLDGVTTEWPATEQVRPLAPTRRIVDFRGLAMSGGDAVVASAGVGDGAVLATAINPLDRGEVGHERLPFLGRLAASWTRAPAGPSRVAVEVYLDPAQLAGTAQQVAARLSGMAAVHVAGRDFDADDSSQFSVYNELVEALHAQGVLAYAWVEPLVAVPRFLDEQPACRRMPTATDPSLRERPAVALQDPTCLSLAWSAWERFVTSFAWDGANVTGLASDSEHTEFAVGVSEAVLARLNGLPRAGEIAFELTIGGGTALTDADRTRLADVAARNGAALQVREPLSSAMSIGPQRFNGIAPLVTGLMPPRQGFVSLQVGSPPGAHLSQRMTGSELDLSVMAAGQSSGRIAIETAGSIGDADLDHLPRALGATAEVFDSGLRSASTVIAAAPGGTAYGRATVDGKRWPAALGHAVVPSGDHRIEWQRGAPEGPVLSRLTGELGTAALDGDVMTFSYDARPPVLAVVDPRPREVLVDGAAFAALVTVRPSGGFVVRLPPGTHRVEMRFGAAA